MRNDGEMVVSPNVWPHKEVNAFEVVWGPVPDDIGVRNGALSGCDSVLICPRVTPQLESIMQRVRALMPDSMFPREVINSHSHSHSAQWISHHSSVICTYTTDTAHTCSILQDPCGLNVEDAHMHTLTLASLTRGRAVTLQHEA